MLSNGTITTEDVDPAVEEIEKRPTESIKTGEDNEGEGREELKYSVDVCHSDASRSAHLLIHPENENSPHPHPCETAISDPSEISELPSFVEKIDHEVECSGSQTAPSTPQGITSPSSGASRALVTPDRSPEEDEHSKSHEKFLNDGAEGS